ncbi:aldehyde dehydrogenase (NADP(+)) [Chryseobacterium indologenes]|uniref:Aldehyde dehydrogenase (NADP(+)) n=1 Tax=Chryseobacterium indologenes TaxID=253 RepID=A0A411DL55_CHRID|nr:aldehyde dehydrogenase (NADP(+)) [Chryseobacterium indologenes]
MMEETSTQNIDKRVQMAVEAFRFLKNTTINDRAEFMNAVADQIEALGEELLTVTHTETALPLARLTGEKARTAGQWRSYAKAVADGIYTEARIDLAQPEKQKGDLRKYNVGIGPVVIFGASNFPFAFSTAGGDTASAIGAGCPVIIKAHPAHPQTSQIMADAISKALFDIASRRKNPIPVFAEMGSINPVFAFQNLLETKAEALAKEYIGSLTLGVGQFCTNPGVFIALKGESFNRFINTLKKEIQKVAPAKMLHKGILDNFEKNKSIALEQPDVEIIASAETENFSGNATVIKTSAGNFVNNPVLSEEVFGPFGIVVECETDEELIEIAQQLKGQLTITIAATREDVRDNSTLITILKDKCGRLLFNGMPTGVEVVYSMQHGGPFPSTTDSRFTSVGPDAVKRFVRPICFQNWPDEFLPDELKNENPLQISRMVDGTVNSESLKLQTT